MRVVERWRGGEVERGAKESGEEVEEGEGMQSKWPSVRSGEKIAAGR